MNLKTFYALIISCLIAIITCIETNDEITVTIKSKQFKGLKKTIDGKEIDYFLGIPYAELPIGKLRFKKPQTFNYENATNATKWQMFAIKSETQVMDL